MQLHPLVLSPACLVSFGSFPGELADMETFATVRVCERFSIPVIGLRGVSDGQSDTADAASWEERLALIDHNLAEFRDKVTSAFVNITG